MEGNKDNNSAVEPVPVDYVIEIDKTKRADEASNSEDGKG